MVEVKADVLEQSFEQFETEDEGVAGLKAELDARSMCRSVRRSNCTG